MKALVLAAGYGTRLYPLTIDRPKPLLPINDVPIIERIVEKVAAVDGLDEVDIVTNARFYPQFQDWVKTYMAPVRLGLYNDGSTEEDNRLGAIRDIQFAIREAEVDEDLLLIGGDNLFELDLAEFCEFAVGRKAPCVAIKDLHDTAKASLYGVVKLDDSDKIVEFVEKSSSPPSTLVSACIYYLPKKSLRQVDTYLSGDNPGDATGNFIQWLAQGQSVFGFTFDELWIDIGDKESFHQANELYAGLESTG